MQPAWRPPPTARGVGVSWLLQEGHVLTALRERMGAQAAGVSP